MAINKKLIHFKNYSDFNSKKLSANEANTTYTVGVGGVTYLGAPDVLYQSICWIRDTKQMWTHGQLYDCSGGSGDVDLSEYLTAEEIAEIYATIESLDGKQDTLVSGTNIKTINGNPILGSGNIEMPYYEGGEYTYVKKGISDDQLMYALPTSADDSEDDTIVTKHFLKTINGQSLFGSGDIAPSGYERKVTVNPGMTWGLSVDNKFMITNILSGQLTIQLPTTNPASDNYAKECGITFTTGSTAPTIIFNGNVWWVNGTAPTIDANSVYEFSFKFNFANNMWLGVYASFKTA